MINGVISYFIAFLSLLFLGSQSALIVDAPTVVFGQDETIINQSVKEEFTTTTTEASDVSDTTTLPPTTTTAIAESTADANQLARCLTAGGAKFYGAYWCSHCTDQKERLGEAFRYINYIECDAGGPNGNPQACIDARIGAYPSWQMPGKADQVGAQTLEALAKWSECPFSS